MEGLIVVAVVVVDMLAVVSSVRVGDNDKANLTEQNAKRRLTRIGAWKGEKDSRKIQTTYLGRHLDILKSGAKAWLFSSRGTRQQVDQQLVVHITSFRASRSCDAGQQASRWPCVCFQFIRGVSTRGARGRDSGVRWAAAFGTWRDNRAEKAELKRVGERQRMISGIL